MRNCRCNPVPVESNLFIQDIKLHKGANGYWSYECLVCGQHAGLGKLHVWDHTKALEKAQWHKKYKKH